MIRQAALGFIAAALAVLTFHQGMWALLHALKLPGLGMPAPFPMTPVPPLGVPRIASLCFWGGLYGVPFGLLLPVMPAALPRWLAGLGFGIIASLVGIFVVAPLKGQMIVLPVGIAWLRPLLINGAWGVGLGLIAPALLRLA